MLLAYVICPYPSGPNFLIKKGSNIKFVPIWKNLRIKRLTKFLVEVFNVNIGIYILQNHEKLLLLPQAELHI